MQNAKKRAQGVSVETLVIDFKKSKVITTIIIGILVPISILAAYGFFTYFAVILILQAIYLFGFNKNYKNLCLLLLTAQGYMSITYSVVKLALL